MAENRDAVWERSRWHLHNGRLEESLVKGQTVHKSVGSSEGTGKGFAAKTVNHTHLHLRQEVPSTPRKSDSYGGAATRQLWGSEEEPTDCQPGAGLRESWGHEDPGCSLLLPSSLLLDPPVG